MVAGTMFLVHGKNFSTEDPEDVVFPGEPRSLDDDTSTLSKKTKGMGISGTPGVEDVDEPDEEELQPQSSEQSASVQSAVAELSNEAKLVDGADCVRRVKILFILATLVSAGAGASGISLLAWYWGVPQFHWAVGTFGLFCSVGLLIEIAVAMRTTRDDHVRLSI